VRRGKKKAGKVRKEDLHDKKKPSPRAESSPFSEDGRETLGLGGSHLGANRHIQKGESAALTRRGGGGPLETRDELKHLPKQKGK